MRRLLMAIVVALVVGCASKQTVVAVPDIARYLLPAETQKSFAELADGCDVLILGETHGTARCRESSRR